MFRASAKVDGDRTSLESCRAKRRVVLPARWQTHGPCRVDALQKLIGASGDTASDVLVGRTGDGPWGPFYSLPGTSRPPGPVIPSALSCSPAAPGPLEPAWAAHTRTRELRGLVQLNWKLALVAGAWLLVNAVIIVGFSQSNVTERGYYLTLRRLEDETKDLQARNASPQDWTAFRAHVKETLSPIVQDLKKRANTTEPISQHLLWAARDQFPKLVGPRTPQTNEPQHLYERHMRLAAEELARQ